MSAGEPCPSLLALERFLHQRLDDSESRVHRAHIEACDRCQAELEAMRGDSFSGSTEEAAVMERLRREEGSARGSRRPVWMRRAAMVLPLAALFVLFFIIPRESEFTPKGPGVFQLRVEREGRRMELAKASPLQKADKVQMLWLGTAPGFLSVLAVERSGEVSVLFSGEVQAGQTSLGGSLVIEETHNRAVLLALFSDSDRFKLPPILERLRGGQAIGSSDFDGSLERIELEVAK